MKNRILYAAVLITTSNLFAGYASYGSDKGRASLSESDKKIIEDTEGAHEGAKERTKKRSKARKLQDDGKKLEETIERAEKPLSYATTIVSVGAAATGDPHAKMGAASLKLSIEAIKALGIGIAKIITITGRYQERSQEILSNAEVILEDVQKSLEEKKKLEKRRQELLAVEKPSTPVQRIGYDLLLMSELPKDGKPAKGKIYLEKLKKNDSTLKDSELKYILIQPDGTVGKGTLKIQTTKDLTPEILSTFNSEILEMITKEGYTASKSESRLKQLGKGALNTMKTVEVKARQTTDILTNDKAERAEKLEAIKADLKVATENYEEKIRLLQIMLVQDAIDEIDRKINIDTTLDKLDYDITFYEKNQINHSKSKSKRKKQIAEDKVLAQFKNDYIYYMKFQKTPTETIQELEEDRSKLENKKNELTQLTKLGDAIYLQKKEVKLDSKMNRAAIVSLYRENDAIKSQIEAIKSQLQTLRETNSMKGAQSPPVKEDARQRAPLDSNKAETKTGPFSKENLIKQREGLRPISPQSK